MFLFRLSVFSGSLFYAMFLLISMKRYLILFTFLCSLSVSAQEKKEVIKKAGYTLTFINEDTGLDPALKQRLISTFFEVYPKLAKTYNPKTAKEVTFVIDTAYKGVAATSNDKVAFSATYMKKKPRDIDVVTHEVMHIVQAYGQTDGPGWLTEGIADFVRYKFGVDNEVAGWSLPAFKPEQSYKNSYRITARFLDWIERKKTPGLVKTLDAAMRNHTYTSDIWQAKTGKSLDQLWAEYAANPNA